MQRLAYHVTVQNDGTVHAELDDGERISHSGQGKLNLTHLEVITKDYLPTLDIGSRQTRDRLERLGTLLYELLFSSIQGHFEYLALDKIVHQPSDYHLCLSLTLQEGLQAEVVALPWEFLYYERERTFLATDPRISFARVYINRASSPTATPPKAGAVPGRFRSTGAQAEAARILLIRLQAPGVAPVALARVKNTLGELAATHDTLVKPYVLENPEPLEVETTLQWYHPHIVHFLLHGRFDDRGTVFSLVDKAGQQVRWYRDRSLADLFTTHRPHLVLLQACEGGRSSDLRSFTNGAAWLVRNHTPAVIAMQYPITNEVGWTFAQAFYTRLAKKDDLDDAIQQARHTLAKFETAAHAQDDHAARDFAAPILWIQPGAQRIFIDEGGSPDLQPADRRQAGDEESPPARQSDARHLFTDEEVSPMNIVNLTITTPDNSQYAATLSTNTLIEQVMQAFLGQWQPPAASDSTQRYSLQTLDAPPHKLDRSSTFGEVGLTGKIELELVSEPLDPYDPIRLTIEDELKKGYMATVLANTQVRQLAEAFLKEQTGRNAAPDIGEIVVEWISGPTEAKTRPLSLDASLYEQGVNDDASLRIYRASSSAKE